MSAPPDDPGAPSLADRLVLLTVLAIIAGAWGYLLAVYLWLG